jgi:hypothetical protein
MRLSPRIQMLLVALGALVAAALNAGLPWE